MRSSMFTLLIGFATTLTLPGCEARRETNQTERRPSVAERTEPESMSVTAAESRPSDTVPPPSRRRTMHLYLTRFSYTPETWARLAKHPEDRRDAARSYIEAVGGKLHGFWYAFGEYDGYTLWEAPDNVAMAAVSVALIGGGALSKVETTVLLTVEETLEALGRVDAIRYRPPGK